MLVKVQGPPQAVADRLARGLATRGYDEQAVRDVLVHDVDGVSLPAAGERLDVLLAFLDGMEARYTAWPLGPDGQPGRAATARKPTLAPLWAVVSVVLFGLAAVTVLWPKEEAETRAVVPDLGVLAVVDAAPPAPDVDPLQVLGEAKGIARAAMEKALAVAVRIETGDGRMGAGVVVSTTGLVLTTAELLRNDRRASVRFADGRFEPARRADTPPQDGFALLLVSEKATQTVAELGRGLGRTQDEAMFVVGSIGADFAVRTGRITRPLVWNQYRPYLTTSAGLGPFHEGAPVFDAEGRVLGITTGGVHRGERLVAFVETVAEGDSMLTSAGVGRGLSDPYTELRANAERGEIEPLKRARARPDLIGSASLVFARRFRRNCPRLRNRGSRICRRDLKVRLLQILPTGARRLESGDAQVRMLALGSKGGSHVQGRVDGWKPTSRRNARGLLLGMGRKTWLPDDPERILQGTAVFSGFDLYRVLSRSPKTDGRFVVRIDGVESNQMTLTY